MSAVHDIREKWAQKLAASAAELTAEELVKEHGVAVVVVVIGTDAAWSFAVRHRDDEDVEATARILRRVSERMLGGKDPSSR